MAIITDDVVSVGQDISEIGHFSNFLEHTQKPKGKKNVIMNR